MGDYQNNITVTTSQANANAALTVKNADAHASRQKIEAENTAIAAVKEQMPGLSPSGMVDYQRNFAYTTKPNASFLFGVQSAVTVLGSSGSSNAQPAPPPPSCTTAA